MSDKFKLQRTVQCAKCPWKVSTDPNDIPNGYSAEKHANLKSTIAVPGNISSYISSLLADHIRIMACHEEHATPCIGWLMNQLRQGNNIALRLRMRGCENLREVKLIGEQHERFEDTLGPHSSCE